MRTLIAAAALTVAATAAVGVNLATGQAPPARTVLKFTATPRGGSGLDVGHKGPSVGDEFFENGKVTGSASGRFQLVTQLVAGNAQHGTEQNTISLTLPGGQLESSGVHGTVSRFEMPISGGTGSYEGARGTLAISPGPRKETESVTITLVGG